MLDVIIVGAGAAGIAAGVKLQKSNLHFQILEARNRLGGRAYTLLPHDFSVELGPEFIHGRAKITESFLKLHAQVSADVPDAHFIMKGKRRVPNEHFWQTLSQTFQKIPKLRKDISMKKAISLAKKASQKDRALLTSFVQGFDASIIGDVSAKEMLGTVMQIEDPEERKVGRTVHGYSSLLHEMAKPIPDRIHFGSEVQKIEWKKNCVLVTYAPGKTSNPRTLLAKKLLITVPIGVLKAQSGTVGSIHFDPPLYEKAKALEGLAMGPVVKMILQFKRDFWSEIWTEPVSMIHTPTQKFQTWWGPNPLRRPLFTAWSGGDPALEISRLSRRELEALVVQEFAQITHKSAAFLKRELEKIHFHDWSDDPYARGAYSFVCTGGSGSREALAMPIEKTLYFAGEATSAEHNGTVEGGLESGIRAAQQILKHR